MAKIVMVKPGREVLREQDLHRYARPLFWPGAWNYGSVATQTLQVINAMITGATFASLRNVGRQ